MAEVQLVNRTRQIQSITGRRQRPILADLTRLSAPRAITEARFQEDQRRLELQEEAQQRQQQQQTVANAISGAGAVLQGAQLAKDTGILEGIFGGGTTTTAPATTTTTGGGGAAAAGGGGAAAGSGAILGNEGVVAGEGISEGIAIPGAEGGAAGAVGEVVSGVGSGVFGAQTAISIDPKKAKTHERIDTAVGTGGLSEIFGTSDEFNSRFSAVQTGIAVGGGLGYLTGGPVGAIVGGIVGGIGAGTSDSEGASSISVCVTASYGEDSEEVHIIKAYRDRYLDDRAMRAYYAIGRAIAARMAKNRRYRELMETVLIGPLVRSAARVIGADYEKPSRLDIDIAETFELLLRYMGEKIDKEVQSTNEELQTPASVEAA